VYVFAAAAEGGGAGMWVAVLRALLSVPAHALWGVMMGYYIGLARFAEDPSRKRPLVIKGVAIAVFWHGLYDFFAFGVEVVSGGVAVLFAGGVLAVVIVNWIIGIRLIRRAQALSCFKRPSPLLNPIAAVHQRIKYCHKCGAPQPRTAAYCTQCGYEFSGPHSDKPPEIE
jgi:ribosomal protein L40E